jgi:hypothetical protein
LNDRHYHFELSAEFNQFYLQDESVKGEVDWTVQEGHDNLAYNFGIIAVGTNCDRVVPVEVQIMSSEPPLNAERWDHLVDCSIDVPSGRLVPSKSANAQITTSDSLFISPLLELSEDSSIG